MMSNAYSLLLQHWRHFLIFVRFKAGMPLFYGCSITSDWKYLVHHFVQGSLFFFRTYLVSLEMLRCWPLNMHFDEPSDGSARNKPANIGWIWLLQQQKDDQCCATEKWQDSCAECTMWWRTEPSQGKVHGRLVFLHAFCCDVSLFPKGNIPLLLRFWLVCRCQCWSRADTKLSTSTSSNDGRTRVPQPACSLVYHLLNLIAVPLHSHFFHLESIFSSVDLFHPYVLLSLSKHRSTLTLILSSPPLPSMASHSLLPCLLASLLWPFLPSSATTSVLRSPWDREGKEQRVPDVFLERL